jgi:gamma-glutamylcyclotransferase (GGCT)/AIG2-like uncharacterized protein YtfP
MKAATATISSVSKVPLFVYGTLMSPVVMESLIQRQINGNPVRLLPSSYVPATSAQASLTESNEELRYDYSRHPVRRAVYPGLVHWNANNDEESIHKTRNYVSGLLYSNLSDEEMAQLDEFEGDQYTKELCYVQLQPNNSNPNSSGEALYNNDDVVQAMVYVWSYPLSDLDLSKDWSYTTFVEEHLATYL